MFQSINTGMISKELILYFDRFFMKVSQWYFKKSACMAVPNCFSLVSNWCINDEISVRNVFDDLGNTFFTLEHALWNLPTCCPSFLIWLSSRRRGRRFSIRVGL